VYITFLLRSMPYPCLLQECGKKELEFVVNSGLYFGTFLGVLQMLVWVVWDPWWSLALGGAVVGYLTNFFAIKSIFEPVQPVKIGPWKFQVGLRLP
jgi:uncharacterized membrane protein YheB (UPF0754 family)